MAAAVVAHIDDQSIARDLGQIAAMEFGIAAWSHIRNMDIADPAVGLGVHTRAIALDPGPVESGCNRRGSYGRSPGAVFGALRFNLLVVDRRAAVVSGASVC